MSLPDYIVSREQHEARSRTQFERLWPDEPGRVERLMERRYPASLAETVDELRSRGLETDVEHLAHAAHFIALDLRVVGRNYLLYPGDIDRLAEYLDGVDRITPDARWRKQCGVPCAQQWAIESEIANRREAKLQAVADLAGVPLQDAFDMTAKRWPDPLGWSDAAIADIARQISAEAKEVLR